MLQQLQQLRCSISFLFVYLYPSADERTSMHVRIGPPAVFAARRAFFSQTTEQTKWQCHKSASAKHLTTDEPTRRWNAAGKEHCAVGYPKLEITSRRNEDPFLRSVPYCVPLIPFMFMCVYLIWRRPYLATNNIARVPAGDERYAAVSLVCLFGCLYWTHPTFQVSLPAYFIVLMDGNDCM